MDPSLDPNTRSLLNYQNVRAILSIAYIDSKIPKSSLAKIDVRKVLGDFCIFK